MAELSKEFLKYHADNPHIWEAFEMFALKVARSGRKRIGSAMIYERMRWYSLFETKGDEFKINNNYKSDYARLFNEKYPEFDNFFPTRERKVACVDINQGEIAA